MLRAFVIQSSQELFPNHQNMRMSQSKDYSHPNSHAGRSRYVPSVLISPLQTQTQTRKPTANTNSQELKTDPPSEASKIGKKDMVEIFPNFRVESKPKPCPNLR